MNKEIRERKQRLWFYRNASCITDRCFWKNQKRVDDIPHSCVVLRRCFQCSSRSLLQQQGKSLGMRTDSWCISHQKVTLKFLWRPLCLLRLVGRLEKQTVFTDTPRISTTLGTSACVRLHYSEQILELHILWTRPKKIINEAKSINTLV